jgi:hypothetical protein
MEYLSYKVLHIISIAALIISFGILIAGCYIGGKNALKKWGFITHGISWLAVFFTAFKLVGILNMHANFPGWAKAKFLCFLLLGIGVWAIKKKPQWLAVHYVVVFTLCSIAIGLAVVKPS